MKTLTWIRRRTEKGPRGRHPGWGGQCLAALILCLAVLGGIGGVRRAAAAIDAYIVPDADSRLLTSDEIAAMNLQVTCYAKNEIYARHGRQFASSELTAYFSNCSWYAGVIAPSAFDSAVFNSYESSNVLALSDHEHALSSSGYKLDQEGYTFDAIYEYMGLSDESAQIEALYNKAAPVAAQYALRNAPSSYTFASGVGAWSTELYLEEDGSFWGTYHDSDASEVYYCSFTGQFTDFRQIDAQTYAMRLSTLEKDEVMGTDWYESGLHYIASEPYGVYGGDIFVLYLEGHPTATLPEEFLSWVRMPQGWSDDEIPSALPFGGLYNVSEQQGFFSSDWEEDAEEYENSIHYYTYHVDDCTWNQAFQKAIDMGGHLVRINSQEEYDYLINEISSMGLDGIKFRVGARRTPNAYEYYWVKEDNSFTGEILNSSLAWCANAWMSGEPSFSDGGIPEMYLEIMYYSKEGRWVFNDVPDDVVAVASYFSGTLGYIVEYQ